LPELIIHVGYPDLKMWCFIPTKQGQENKQQKTIQGQSTFLKVHTSFYNNHSFYALVRKPLGVRSL